MMSSTVITTQPSSWTPWISTDKDYPARIRVQGSPDIRRLQSITADHLILGSPYIIVDVIPGTHTPHMRNDCVAERGDEIIIYSKYLFDLLYNARNTMMDIMHGLLIHQNKKRYYHLKMDIDGYLLTCIDAVTEAYRMREEAANAAQRTQKDIIEA